MGPKVTAEDARERRRPLRQAPSEGTHAPVRVTDPIEPKIDPKRGRPFPRFPTAPGRAGRVALNDREGRFRAPPGGPLCRAMTA